MEHEKGKCIESDRKGNQAANENEVLLPGLPTELAVSCLARVPRSHHRSMRGVSRSWRNLFHGTMLWEIRRRMSLTEELLYLWLEYESKQIPFRMNYARHAEFRNELYCFDPSLEKWSKLPAIPQDSKVAGHSTFASLDEKLFVIGGYFLNSYISEKSYIPCMNVSYFDTKCFCWKKAGSLNVARADCMAGLIDNQLYVFGGKNEGATTKTAEVYDPTTNTWKLVSSMKYPMKLLASVVMGKKFYGVTGAVLGGYNSNEWQWQGVVYDAQTNKWENMASELRTGWSTQATVLNGRIYTVGKEDTDENSDPDGSFADEEFYQKIWVYSPSKKVWEKFYELSHDWGKRFAKRGVEVVTFCGKLCLVCVDPFEDEEMAYISLILVEVEESVEGPTGQLTFENWTEIPLPGFGIDNSDPIKNMPSNYFVSFKF